MDESWNFLNNDRVEHKDYALCYPITNSVNSREIRTCS